MIDILFTFLLILEMSSARVADYVTPGGCDIHSRFDDRFLLDVFSVRNKIECYMKCHFDKECRSLTFEGEEPHIECRTYYQDTNEFGLYLTSVQTKIIYMEKVNKYGRPKKEKCTRTSKDQSADCYKRSDKLYPDDYLFLDERLCSGDGAYMAILQADGNFVVYQLASMLVGFNAAVSGNNYATLQMADGNLVIYDSTNGDVKTETSTFGIPMFLHMGNDGRLVVYSANKDILWTTEAIYI